AALEDGFCTNQGSSTTPTLCSFTTNFSNDMYVGFFSTENTNLVLPADLTGLVVNQYLAGSNFGVAAGDKHLGSAGTVPADVGSMNNGGWATVALALKALNSDPMPTATATSTATPTVTATQTATPTVTAALTATATARATQTETATATATRTATPTVTATQTATATATRTATPTPAATGS